MAGKAGQYKYLTKERFDELTGGLGDDVAYVVNQVGNISIMRLHMEDEGGNPYDEPWLEYIGYIDLLFEEVSLIE